MSFDCIQKDVSNGNDDQTAPTLVPEEPTWTTMIQFQARNATLPV